MRGRAEKCIYSGWKTVGNRQLGRPRYRLEDNIKKDLGEKYGRNV
jgi:hypothetical protein